MFRNSRSEFEKLTLPYSDRLYRLAFWRLQSREDAEDAVQVTYLRAYRSFRTFKAETNARAWLTKILLNVINDTVSKKLRNVQSENFEEHLEEIEMQSSAARSVQDPAQQLEQSEVNAELMAALRELPGVMLQPLLLREIDDMTYAEIGDVLGLPLGTVMSRLFRARQLVKASLNRRAGVPGTLVKEESKVKSARDEGHQNELQ